MKKRHVFFYHLARPLVILFARLRFDFHFEKAKDLPKHYIVLSNHTTDYDLLFVASSFPRMMYFVGSEHIARWKHLYKILKFCFDPIMRPKGTSASGTVIEMMKRAKKGHSLCLFAEGVRSWDGTPSPIVASTAKMVRRMGCGLVTYRITGGYFASPMWAGANVRRGYVHGGPVHVFTPEQLEAMTNEELYDIIVTDLGEDAYATQQANPRRYKSKTPAEGLENLLFVCPLCREQDSLHSLDDTVTCSSCGLSFRCNEYGLLEDAPYTTLTEFNGWQKEQVAHDAQRGACYTAAQATLSAVKGHREELLATGVVSMDSAALRCGEVEFAMDSITDLAMHGQRALVFTANKIYYELICAEGSNALKFFLYYRACKNRVEQPEKVR